MTDAGLACLIGTQFRWTKVGIGEERRTNDCREVVSVASLEYVQPTGIGIISR